MENNRYPRISMIGLFLLIYVPTCLGQCDLITFTKREELGSGVCLGWNYVPTTGNITFQLQVNNPVGKGYSGIGISRDGDMAGSDIFVAGAYADGRVYSSVRIFCANFHFNF